MWGWAVAVVSECISIACCIHLWRRDDRFAKKLLWTQLVFLPVLGPLFYGGFYALPSVQPESHQSKSTSLDGGGPVDLGGGNLS